MIKKKSGIIGTTKDSQNRKFVAIKKNGELIIRINAAPQDISNINNCGLQGNSISTNFDAYIKNISENFDNSNEEFNRFISRFVYACSIKKLIYNNFTKFTKTNIMFSYYLEVDEILEAGVSHRFKL